MFEKLIQKTHKDSVKRDQELLNHINMIIKTQNLNNQIAVIEQYKQILSHLYQNAISYTNLIILAGYAGIFAIWQLTRDKLDNTITIWIALLISCSLIIFVGHEVWKMISEALFFRRLNKIIEKNITEKDRITAWQLAFVEYAQRQSKTWAYFLIPTVLFGFSAGFILIYQFIKTL